MNKLKKILLCDILNYVELRCISINSVEGMVNFKEDYN